MQKQKQNRRRSPRKPVQETESVPLDMTAKTGWTLGQKAILSIVIAVCLFMGLAAHQGALADDSVDPVPEVQSSPETPEIEAQAVSEGDLASESEGTTDSEVEGIDPVEPDAESEATFWSRVNNAMEYIKSGDAEAIYNQRQAEMDARQAYLNIQTEELVSERADLEAEKVRVAIEVDKIHHFMSCLESYSEEK